MQDHIAGWFEEFQAAPRRVQIVGLVLCGLAGVGGAFLLHGPATALLTVIVAIVAPWLFKPYYNAHGGDDLLTAFKHLPDFHRPGLRGIAVGLLGFVGIVAVELTVGILWVTVGPETAVASHGTTQAPADPALWKLALLVVWVAALGPFAEELAFRNGIQKLLTYRTGPVLAILLTSTAFASLHVPAYGGLASGVGLLPPLVTIFAGSAIFGTLYWRTDNVAVPTIAHGLFNAVGILVSVVLPALA